MAGDVDRLAGIGTFGGQEFIEAAIDAVGHRVEFFHPLGHRHAGPRAIQRGARGGDRLVHGGAIGFVHLGDDFAGQRGCFVEGTFRGHVLAIDEVADLFHGHASLVVIRSFVHSLMDGFRRRTRVPASPGPPWRSPRPALHCRPRHQWHRCVHRALQWAIHRQTRRSAGAAASRS